jgi:rRNA-processing protein FCF1
VSTALFFQYNAQLGPPYQVLVDTNFINFAIKNKVRPRRQLSEQQNVLLELALTSARRALLHVCRSACAMSLQ